MEINKKKRNQSFDQVAGICIIFMIFTHICQLSYQTGWPVYMKSLGIFYFYMYFFFMKSGMLFHEKSIKCTVFFFSCCDPNVKLHFLSRTLLGVGDVGLI